MKVRISVTQKDINTGYSDTESCPVAIAIRRRLNNKIGNNIIVLSSGVFANNVKWKKKFPSKVQNFILSFDNDGKSSVKPMTFNIEIPKKYLKEVK